MEKNFLFIICLILLIVSISSVSASDNLNQSVSDGTENTIGVSYSDADVLSDAHNIVFDNDIIKNISADAIDLDVPDVTKYYGGSERLEVTYKFLGQPMKNTTIKISINGIDYYKTTNDEGKTSLALNLDSGVYDAHVSHLLIITKSAKVTINPTVDGNDLIKMYGNASKYYAKFIDSQGQILKNTDIKFNVNGVEYTRKTNGSGIAALNINLNPGQYIITATNPVTKEMHSNRIYISSPIVENRDLTKYYRNASQYTIRLLDNNGNPVGKGVSALFNINGVFYNRTSDENGYVKLNINLNPGDYIITAEYDGYKVSNNIKVLPVLVGSDLTKQFLDLPPYTVKLVDGQGFPLIGKVITLNINGVMYNRTTDLLGYARLNINLWPGQYIITAMYPENGAVTSNKITITSIFG